LCKNHKGSRRLRCDYRPAGLLLPLVTLSLIQKPTFHRGNKLLRLAPVIGVVSFPATCQCDVSSMMKVIVPHCIEAISAPGNRSDTDNVLRFVFCNQYHYPWMRGFSHFL